jgi:hypothetical protein
VYTLLELLSATGRSSEQLYEDQATVARTHRKDEMNLEAAIMNEAVDDLMVKHTVKA